MCGPTVIKLNCILGRIWPQIALCIQMSLLILVVIWKIVKGMCVGSPLSCNPGSDYGDLLALAHHLIYVVVLVYLVCNITQLGFMLQGMHLLLLTLIIRLVLVLLKKNSWFLVLEGRIAHVNCVCV